MDQQYVYKVVRVILDDDGILRWYSTGKWDLPQGLVLRYRLGEWTKPVEYTPIFTFKSADIAMEFATRSMDIKSYAILECEYDVLFQALYPLMLTGLIHKTIEGITRFWHLGLHLGSHISVLLPGTVLVNSIKPVRIIKIKTPYVSLLPE